MQRTLLRLTRKGTMGGSIWNEEVGEMRICQPNDLKVASALLSKERTEKITLKALVLRLDGLQRASTRELMQGFLQRLDAFEQIAVFQLTLVNLSDEAVVKLTKSFIPKNRLIGELHLTIQGGEVTDYGLRILCERLVQELLLHEGRLTSMSISSCPELTTVGCDELAKFIHENNGFVRLDEFALESCQRVGVEGCKYLLNSLVSNARKLAKENETDGDLDSDEDKHRRSLSLQSMSIGNIGADILSKCLEPLALTTLDLSRSKIHESGSVQLFQTLRKSTPLIEELNMSHNHCGDRGLRALGKWIQRGSFLMTLKLVAVKSSVREFDAFLGCLDAACYNRVSHLQNLDISENGLGDSVIGRLVDTLSMRTCSIRRLGYNENSLTDDGAAKWARLFESQRMLMKTGEGTDGYSMVTLKRKLKRMNSRPVTDIAVPFFESLELKNNYLTSEGASLLAAALRKVESDHYFLNPFRKLDLSGNRIGVQGASHWMSYFLARPESCFPFELIIRSDDVQGVLGMNHLLAGCKQAGPNNIQGFQLLLLANEEEFKQWMTEMEFIGMDETALDSVFFSRTDDKEIEYKVKISPDSDKSVQRAEDATHTSTAFNISSNGKVDWAKWVWDEVKTGYSAVMSNALYRVVYLMLVRERTRAMLSEVDFNSVSKTGVLVSLWQQLVVRKQKKYKGMCMLEFVLSQGAQPLLDVVLQLRELFELAFKTQKFLSYVVPTTGKTILTTCLGCHDPAVREWVVKAEMKSDKFL